LYPAKEKRFIQIFQAATRSYWFEAMGWVAELNDVSFLLADTLRSQEA